MKRLVITTINSKFIHSSLAVWILAEAVAQRAKCEYFIDVLEYTIKHEIDEIVAEIATKRPDVVAVSTYIWNSAHVDKLLPALKSALPETIVILGGPEALKGKDYWISKGADHVIFGEGEYLLPELLDSISGERNNECSEYRDDSNYGDYKCSELIDPYTEKYLSALDGKIAYIETSRGCSFSCEFCLSGEDELRYYDLRAAKSRILKLINSNARMIKFVDRTFNIDCERTFELIEYILKLDTDKCVHFEVSPDLFDEKCLSLLKTATPGKIQLEAGLQSFHEPALRAVRAMTNLKKSEAVLREIIQENNIHVHVDLIAGLPYEGLIEFNNSFNRAFNLEAHCLQLGFLKSLYGSKLRERADELGMYFASAPPYEIIKSRWLSPEDITVLKTAENALNNTYNKHRFLLTIKYMLEVSGLSPFSFFYSLGKAVPNHGMQLQEYADELYLFFKNQQGVDIAKLCDVMKCDWLSMVKGKNKPDFMSVCNKMYNQLYNKACALFGRKIRKTEVTVLSTGLGVVVDSLSRDPITSLFLLHYVDF